MNCLSRPAAAPTPPLPAVQGLVRRPLLRPGSEIDRWTGRPAMRGPLAPAPGRPRPEEAPHGRGQ